MMLILLPLAGLSLVILFMMSKYPSSRESMLLSAVIWGALIVFITETLSFFHVLNKGTITISWGMIVITFLILVITAKRNNNISQDDGSDNVPVYPFFFMAAVCFITFITGVVSAPNTGDSQIYHLAKVFYWIQNGSVDYYPTNIIRQISLAPFAEYVILQFNILTSGDRFAFLAQWLAMIGSVIGVSAIAKELGAKKHMQIFASVFCITLPMGILQAASTQTDYVAAFWLVTFVYFMIKAESDKKLSSYMAMGGALGLAVLTKSTSYVYVLPFLVWAVFTGFRRKTDIALKYFILAMLAAVLINIPFYSRNFTLYGDPMGNPVIKEMVKADIANVYLYLSNIIKNLSLHFYPPVWAGRFISDGMIIKLHGILPISAGDPRITFGNFSTPHFLNFFLHEDHAGNFVHFWLIISALCLLAFKRGKKPLLGGYILSLIGGFLLFSYLLKWQTWGSRLHLPLFVLAAPFVSTAFSGIKNVFSKNKTILFFLIPIFVLTLASGLSYALFRPEITGYLSALPKVSSFLDGGSKTAEAAKTALSAIILQIIVFGGIASLCLYILYEKREDIWQPIALILFITALPWLLFNESRPLFGDESIFKADRDTQYFHNRPGLEKSYLRSIDFVNNAGYTNIGIVAGVDTYEYPFLKIASETSSKPLRFQQIEVENESGRLFENPTYNEFVSDVVVVLDPAKKDVLSAKKNKE